jgi:2,3-bisphosphoglycerate-independent phosphoglycerate mutase
MATAANKVCLVVIDGWGVAPASKYNAITNAKTPVMDALENGPLTTLVKAHGLDVGLPDGVMGNSEVGHLTIGAGRINFQDFERINFSIADKSIEKNQVLLTLIENAKKNNNRLHLCGLVSDGGVHSHIDHLKALLKLVKSHGIQDVFIHCFTDGRDTKPTSALGYLKDLQNFLEEIQFGQIATVCGRYYAMDRDQRWERVEFAYNAMVDYSNAQDVTIVDNIQGLWTAVEAKYENGEKDEFFKPIVMLQNNIQVGRINDNDSMLFFNYRSDRMREIVTCFGTENKPFEKESTVIRENLHVVQFTRYDSKLPLPVVFSPLDMRDGLAEWVSKQGMKQFHVAETEKYAHVTFFFNGGIEQSFENEDRGLIPSPTVATYDLQPEMSAIKVGERCAEAVEMNKYELVICNFAPPDMVGHTGVYDAAVIAAETTDTAIGLIQTACEKMGYVLAITADHGNCEKMMGDDGVTPHTAHTSNLVPFHVYFPQNNTNKGQFKVLKEGGLRDVAPTVLKIMGITPPECMTGSCLLE